MVEKWFTFKNEIRNFLGPGRSAKCWLISTFQTFSNLVKKIFVLIWVYVLSKIWIFWIAWPLILSFLSLTGNVTILSLYTTTLYYYYLFYTPYAAMFVLLNPCCYFELSLRYWLKSHLKFKKIVFNTKCVRRKLAIHVEYNYYQYYLVKRIAL